MRSSPSGLGDPREDPLARVVVDHRPDVGLLVGRIADLQRLDLRHELGDEAVPRVVERRRSAAPRCSSGRRTRTRSRRASRPCRRARRRRRSPASRSRARALTCLRGARSFSFQPTSPEPVNVSAATRSSSTSTSPISDDEPATTLSQPAGRPASSIELGEEQRRERRRRRGLEHDGAARRERGRELVRDEVAREVERRDRADDAARHAQREARAFPRPPAPRPSAPSRPRACAPRRRRTCTSTSRASPRRAPPSSACPPRREISRATSSWRRPSSPGDLDEDLGALVRRQRLAHRALGRVDRAPRLGGAGLRDAPDDVAGVGRADLEPVAGLDPLAADEELALSAVVATPKSRTVPREARRRLARSSTATCSSRASAGRTRRRDRASGGRVLVDTGMSTRRPSSTAEWGIRFDADKIPRDVVCVVNTHLHFDHCGGKPALRGRRRSTCSAPSARPRAAAGYTIPEWVDVRRRDVRRARRRGGGSLPGRPRCCRRRVTRPGTSRVLVDTDDGLVVHRRRRRLHVEAVRRERVRTAADVAAAVDRIWLAHRAEPRDLRSDG